MFNRSLCMFSPSPFMCSRHRFITGRALFLCSRKLCMERRSRFTMAVTMAGKNIAKATISHLAITAPAKAMHRFTTNEATAAMTGMTTNALAGVTTN